MKFWRSLFLEDLTRKLLALGIAMLIWWRVDASLEKPHQWPFTIVTGSGAPNPHEIQVKVPDGWLLVSPKPGDVLTLNFRGNDQIFQDFTSTLCAASVTVQLDESGNQTNSEFNKEANELDWLRKGLALDLLNKAQEKNDSALKNSTLSFQFERHDIVEKPLHGNVIQVQGTAAEGYQYNKDDAQFSPNVVRIHGPFGVAENVHALQLRDELFEPVTCPDGMQTNLVREIKLHASALDGGMWMEPDSFIVTVPIRKVTAEPIEWRPTKPIPIGTSPDGLAWTVGKWSDGMWRASYEEVEGLDIEFNEDWLAQNIDLVVHLDQIREGAVDGYELHIDWIISDPNLMASRTSLEKLKNAVTIWPSWDDEVAARTVEMRKPE